MQITLKAARVNAGLTQIEVKRLTGYAQSSLSDWESGKRRLPDEAREKLCKLYGIDVTQVIE